MILQSLLQKSIIELKNAGIQTPELDAKILLKESIKKDEVFLLAHPEYLVSNSQYSKFRKFIKKRKTGEPIAYILGHKEFFGNDFIVNKNVLIPRPETEWLVEKSLAFFQNYELRIKNQREVEQAQLDKKINILDMGTGSGCIIISIIKELKKQCNDKEIKQFNFYGIEISKKAIGVAKKNSKLFKVDKYIKFYNSDLFSNRLLKKKYNLIIANLPYVPCQKIVSSSVSAGPSPDGQLSVHSSIDFEPQSAIFADDNGMAIVKRFLIEAKSHIVKNGLILLELDCRNAKLILEFAKKQFPHSKVELSKDLAGLDRYITLKK